jgi:hypothetical protein
VLQWDVPFPIQNLDDFIAIEEVLIETYRGVSRPVARLTDDFGSGEANIVVYTDHPESEFSALRPLLRVPSQFIEQRRRHGAESMPSHVQ